MHDLDAGAEELDADCKEMPDTGKTPSARDARLSRVRVVLVGTTHPGNIGAAARALKTMGLRELLLVSPLSFPHADATARASGADDVLARVQVVDTLSEAVAPCTWVVGTSARARHIRWPEVDARQFAAQALDRAASGNVAVVFGRESSGLSNDELDRCHALLRLPAAADFSSLNLAAAVQVVAYELRMAATAGAVQPQQDGTGGITQQEMDRFYVHLEQALTDIGYFDPEAPRLLRRRLRRMFNRMAPDRPELNILRGILTAAQQRVRRD
jgi:TrmH family RNA methyltransferase